MDELNPFYGMSKAFLDKFGGKAAEKPAETVGYLWDIVGLPIEFFSKKQRYKYEHDFEDFKQSFIKNISYIPDDNIQEPSLSIVVPSLESAKYYLGDKDIREMFTKLIAKSMDKQYNEEITHAFVEVIKQLSPVDAHIIVEINNSSLAVGRYIASFKHGTSAKLNDYFIIDQKFSPKKTSISLVNLERLGLITLEEGPYSYSVDKYNPFYETEEYKHHLTQNHYVLRKNFLNKQLALYNNDEQLFMKDSGMNKKTFEITKNFVGIEVQKTTANLTSFGKAFFKVCVLETD